MNNGESIRKVLSFLLWLFLLFVALVAPKFFNYAWWSVLASAFPFTIKLAYDHFDWINLFVNRSILWITNKTVSWEMKIHYTGNYSSGALDDIVMILRDISTLKLIQSDVYEKTINLTDLGMVIKIFIAEIRTDEDEFSNELVLSVQRMFVPFRHSTKTLHTLITMIDKMKARLDINSERYDFKAIFTDANPYLGMFLRRLKMTESTTVNVNYGEREGAAKAKITVNKNKVALVATDLHSLQSFSKKYITLSSLNLSEV